MVVRATRMVRVAAIILSTACYRYSPVIEPTVSPGAHVRFAIEQQGTPALRSVLGDETIGVEGLVVAATDSAYALSVEATLKRGAVANVPRRLVWAGESVLIPRASVTQVERRSLDRKRTTRAIALATVVAVVTVKLIVSTIGSSSGGDDGGVIVTPP